MNSLMLQPLRKYADFEGRARRSEYWLFTLFHVLLWIGLGVFVGLMFTIGGVTRVTAISGAGVLIAWFALMVIGLGLFIPSLAVAVRRLHDINMSGWWLLLNIVPFGAFVILVFCIIEGNSGPNHYGRDPKGAPILPPGEAMSTVFS